MHGEEDCFGSQGVWRTAHGQPNIMKSKQKQVCFDDVTSETKASTISNKISSSAVKPHIHPKSWLDKYGQPGCRCPGPNFSLQTVLLCVVILALKRHLEVLPLYCMSEVLASHQTTVSGDGWLRLCIHAYTLSDPQRLWQLSHDLNQWRIIVESIEW